MRVGYDPMMDPHCSVYPQAPGLTGEARYFGLFPGQRIMGYSCSIKTDKLPDGAPQAVDILGLPGTFRVGELAIHISGLNSFGERVGARQIKAIGMYQIIFATPDGKKPKEKNTSFGGTGVDEPEACVIVGDHYHHAMFSSCDHFVTLRGIHALCHQGPFHPVAVCEHIDEVRAKTRFPSTFRKETQHVRAVRRLLEDALMCGEEISGQRIERTGRWNYRWRG